MEHHRTHTPMRSVPRLVAGLLVALAALGTVVGFAGPVSGGGWAVGSLDAIPDARAGATEPIGFTILQHGVTPAAVDGEVGIEIVGADGEIAFFEAVPDGVVGHYVAATTFPTAGDYTWKIRMGWFPSQDLGALTVTPSDGSSLGGGDARGVARWGVLGLATALAAVAIVDVLAGRRRARSSSAT